MQTAGLLYARRAQNGHPEAVYQTGWWKWWDPEEAQRWRDEQLAAMKARLSPVDRSGDPDELVNLTEAAGILGIEPTTISSYRSRNVGYFPDPDVGDRWRRSTIWAFADGRTGRGGRASDPTT